ncbi:hypothetical protein ASF12_22710 [Paenibacillus sp. Leaf72]|nr:hypothetical protein ASF12_22710 [Paenibacillus sp. Leaf72]
MNREWLKDRLWDYFSNYAAYLTCVWFLSFIMDIKIDVKLMFIMLIGTVVILELMNGIKWTVQKFLKRKSSQ